MKLDEEFKKETNKAFTEGDYIGRKVGVRVILIIVALAVSLAVGGMAYKKWRVGQEREIFKNSVTYTESAASFLADCYKQYNETEDEAERNTIMEYVIMRYPNLNTEDIDNNTLRQFYNQCLKH